MCSVPRLCARMVCVAVVGRGQRRKAGRPELRLPARFHLTWRIAAQQHRRRFARRGRDILDSQNSLDVETRLKMLWQCVGDQCPSMNGRQAR
jgi:hypothetical protein